MVRQNHATIRMNRKCAGNQYFLIDDEGNDGANKSASNSGTVTQVIRIKVLCLSVQNHKLYDMIED